jgi:hypothetical protein
MVGGVIEFLPPEDKSIIRSFVRKMNAKTFLSSGLNEEGLLEGYKEGAG